MDTDEPHDLTVSHFPLEGPGMRITRPGDDRPNDVNITYLRAILDSSEANLALTEAARADPATSDLAEAVRASLLGLDAIVYHLLELHRGIAQGEVNYTTNPDEGYP